MANLDAEFSNQIFRKDYPMVLACNRHLATILAVRLVYDSGGYAAGQALALNSNSGLYQKYNSGGSSGLNSVKCILFMPLDVSEFLSTTGTALMQAIFGGEVYFNSVVGADGSLATQVGGKVVQDATGTQILMF